MINDYLESYDEEIVLLKNYATTRIMQDEDNSFSLTHEEIDNDHFTSFKDDYDDLR